MICLQSCQYFTNATYHSPYVSNDTPSFECCVIESKKKLCAVPHFKNFESYSDDKSIRKRKHSGMFDIFDVNNKYMSTFMDVDVARYAVMISERCDALETVPHIYIEFLYARYMLQL